MLFGRRETSIAQSRSRARSLTADAVKDAGPDAIPEPIPGHEAKPRRCRDGDVVMEVEGTGIKFVVPMPINGSRRPAELSPVELEAAERMSQGRRAMRKF